MADAVEHAMQELTIRTGIKRVLGSPTFERDREDSDSEEETLKHRHPLGFLAPAKLAEIKHLNLTGKISFDERKVVTGVGSGDIFKAPCDFDGKRTIVWIKRLRLWGKLSIRMVFEREVYVRSKLNHPNIPSLLGYAFDDETGYPLFVSKWMKNESAWSYIQSHADYCPMRLIVGIAKGLEYLHEHGIVHSKVTLDNVIVTDSGEAVICGFSCSREFAQYIAIAAETKRRGLVYVAPEILKSRGSFYSKGMDVWAFGMTVFELLVRRRPYKSMFAYISAIMEHESPALPKEDMCSVSPGIRDGLSNICQLCWKYDPEDRPSIRVIVNVLHSLHFDDQPREDINNVEPDSDSDLDPDNEGPSPMKFVLPAVLEDLKHLNITGKVFFRERRVIAGGGHGDVFKGYHIEGEKRTKVCIKRVRFHVREIAMLFDTEIYVWSKLNHPNILPLLGYAIDSHTGYPLLVSRWMKNGSAWNYITSKEYYDLKLLVTGISAGLAYLHGKDVLHMDMKSDNVLVAASGEAVISDFGCSRMLFASRSFAKVTTQVRGTMNYIAYELLTSSDAVHSKESDVWAFGMTIYEFLTRQRPYGNAADYRIMAAMSRHELPELPENLASPASPAFVQLLWKICQLCWEFDPADRPTIGSILEQLREF